jgi:bacillithiol biosynthesis deacetylase BshB1
MNHSRKIDCLAFAAHPDDVELNCGGTVARLVQQGLKVGIIDLTTGQMGSRGSTESRLKEAEKASEILGIELRENLGFMDSEILNDRQHRLKVIEIVRKYRPDICLIGAPNDRHPDHGNATRLLIDSLFYSGLKKIKDASDQQPWRPSHILHYMQDRPFDPDFVFDISSTIEIKMQALKAFGTQFNVSDAADEEQTYISTEGYFEQIKARARFYGHLSGFDFGEAFKYYNGPVPLADFSTFIQTQPKR